MREQVLMAAKEFARKRGLSKSERIDFMWGVRFGCEEAERWLEVYKAGFVDAMDQPIKEAA